MKKTTTFGLTGFFIAGILLFLCTSWTMAQQLAFPGAEGFGRNAIGGRGGTVYHVTNLNDSGAGSFRDAVSQPNRTVVFDVGGIINISSRIVIQRNITIAGQTAPGGGITIYGNGIALNGDSGNNIIRYIRIRMGKNGDSEKDAVAISAGQNYIFDHVSISWGRDGTLDVNGSGIDNLTFQDCIISQGINNTNHSTGGLMQSGKWSMIRSLYIDNKTRNPKARGTHEFINSVLYNWAEHGYIMGDTQGLSQCNLIGNYFIYGPSSNSNTHITNTTPSFHVYASDNWVDSNKDGVLNGSRLTDYKTATVESAPYNYPGVLKIMSAQAALNHIIGNVGASIVRDAVDNLLINQLKSYGTSGRIINTEDDNGIPGNVGTVANGTPATDSDRDGMPNTWETANGLNPNNASDRNNIGPGGYTMLEIYINSLVGGTPSQNTLNVSTTSLNVAAAAGSTGTFNVTSNISWTVSSNQSWLTVSPSSGSNNGTITVTASQNTSTSTRSATVTVAATGVSSRTVTVTQAAGSSSSNSVSVNAGGSASGSFSADQYFSGGSTYNNSAAINMSQITSNPPPAAIFNSERYGAFTYTVSNRMPGSEQTVTLYFAEIYFTAAGARVFNVSINGTSVLSNFDIYTAAGGANRAIARSFNTTANSSGQVVIQFSAVTNNPKISGITVTGSTSSTARMSVTPEGSESAEEGALEIAVYPVPARDALTVEFSRELEGEADIYVTDIMGKVLRRGKAAGKSGTIETSGLSQGTYIVRVAGKRLNATMRITKD